MIFKTNKKINFIYSLKIKIHIYKIKIYKLYKIKKIKIYTLKV